MGPVHERANAAIGAAVFESGNVMGPAGTRSPLAIGLSSVREALPATCDVAHRNFWCKADPATLPLWRTDAGGQSWKYSESRVIQRAVPAQFHEGIPMIDHVSVGVRNLDAAGEFYDSVLTPLGLVRLVTRAGTIGYGKRYPEFWLNSRPGLAPNPDSGTHVCLRARDEAAVRSFHAIALQKGGADDGAPGPRQGAMTEYFGAFILDPDGNKIEAVTFPPRS